MTRRRILLWTIGLLLLLLAVAGLALREAWLLWQQQNGITRVHWQGLEVAPAGIAIGQLVVTQQLPSRLVTLEARGLRLGWNRQWLNPEPRTLTIDRLAVDWQGSLSPASAGTAATHPETSVSPLPAPPRWLPQQLVIRQYELSLPCASGSCELTGSFDAQRQQQMLPVAAELVIVRDQHRVELQADIAGSGPDDLVIRGGLSLDGEPVAKLESVFQRSAAVTNWSGALAMPALPASDWLLAWLQEWQPMDTAGLPPQPDSARLDIEWQLQAPPGQPIREQVSGSLRLDVELPDPWPVPGLATIQGDLRLALVAELGVWSGQLEAGRIRLSRPELVTADWTMKGVRADLAVTGTVDSNTLVLEFQQPSVLTVERFDQVAASDLLAARNLTLDPGKAQLRASYRTAGAELQSLELQSLELQSLELQSLELKGPLRLAADRLISPYLVEQSWRFDGTTTASLDRVAVNGHLRSHAGATADLQLDYAPGKALKVKGSTRLSGEQGAAALAATIAHWPQELAVSGGSLSARIELLKAPGAAAGLEGALTFTGLSGIYGRTAWSGLEGLLTLNLAGTDVEATAPALSVASINPGIPVESIRLAGRYRAPLANVRQGRLRLDQAKGELLGGQVTVVPGQWELSDLPFRLRARLDSIALAELMQVYPAEGLAGTGFLTGEVPVTISAAGVQVEQGRVTAQSPGGLLQLPAERLTGLASGNETMRLVAEALQNFHYSVLESTIDYDQEGNLMLGLHLEGRNPKVRDGHPIVLNINLEENIPALLTSLQLSGRVNETVTRKVQELLRKKAEQGGTGISPNP
ncbi:YdbH domain-containing protein [Marinobacter sp.]|uniref:YdbH domain-containing protein n=1 Tax=Marinobacter sp. TaxID=50741 RepID=UPI0019C324C9|nr:YdbH domain-containing protein [Marinobacter sp.]MBD3657062.1 YdbH domain-containing protein [Marinobacter sp.]